MIKLFFFLIFTSFSCFYGQEKNCSCEKYEQLTDCKKHFFSNGASFHWEYDCDTGKLYFENKKTSIKLYEVESDFIEKIGYQFAFEYENKILFINKWISGCCEPVGFNLHDKTTGKLIRKIEKGIIYNNDKNTPYLVYLNKNLNKLILLNINTLKTIEYSLPKNKILFSIQNSEESIAEFLFEDTKFDKKYFKVSFKFFENNKWNYKKISIKLN